MNADAVRAELDDELTWRQGELQFLRNSLSDLRTEADRARFRRTMVVMLYSHLEGFWARAFTIYLEALNRERIPCERAVHSLVAATHAEALAALSSNKKAKFFGWTPPDDPALHQLCRQVEFLARVVDVQAAIVQLPADRVVDTESNLKPDVVKKTLYRIGMPHDTFEGRDGDLHLLLNKRNTIAHGDRRADVEASEYDGLESAVVSIMREVVVILFDWIREGKYLRTPPA